MTVAKCTVTMTFVYNPQILDLLETVKHLWASPPLPLKEVLVLNTQIDGLQYVVRHTLVLDHGPYDAEGDSYICKLLDCDPNELLWTSCVTNDGDYIAFSETF